MSNKFLTLRLQIREMVRDWCLVQCYRNKIGGMSPKMAIIGINDDSLVCCTAMIFRCNTPKSIEAKDIQPELQHYMGYYTSLHI